MAGGSLRVRLLFADEGEFHTQEVDLPGEGFADYERLIDFIREDAAVLKKLYIDVERLCSAELATGD